MNLPGIVAREMRVAVRHTDEQHPNGHWFAFEHGRILGHTDPITGNSHTPEEVAKALLERARRHFPAHEGYEHRVETLHDAGDGTAEWHPEGASELPRIGAGQSSAHELTIPQGQAAAD